MSEDIDETRKREIEEFRKRYLAENPPIEWADFLMTIPPGKCRGNVHSMFKRHSNPEYAEVLAGLTEGDQVARSDPGAEEGEQHERP